MPGVDTTSTMPASPARVDMGGGSGLIVVKSNEQLLQEEQQLMELARNEKVKQRPTEGVVGYVLRCWDAARMEKQEVGERLKKCLRRRRGEYDPDKLAEILNFGGSVVYMMLTNVKARAAEAWCRDILMPAGDRPWSLEPTPEPELPPVYEQAITSRVLQEAMLYEQVTGATPAPETMVFRAGQIRDMVKQQQRQEAMKLCDRMSTVIDDQLTEGNFEDAFDDMLQDICTYPSAVVKGPIVRVRRKLVWGRERDGSFAPMVEKRLVVEFERVSPFDLYPAPGSTEIEDGFIIQRHDLTRSDLEAMIGVQGFRESAVRQVLTDHGEGGLKNWLWVSDEDTENDSSFLEHQSPEVFIEGLEFWGTVQGKMLREWGMSPKEVPDQYAEYPVNLWLIGETVIRLVINPDPLGRKPFYKASFSDVPGSFWGTALPELMSDIQDVCNACARSLVNNMAISSGPQVEVVTDRMAPGEDFTNIYPWKIWQVQSDVFGTAGGSRAVNFFQPDPVVEELLKIYEYFSKLADDYTGIPAYAYGGTFNVGGAGRTASGLSMLMSAASKGIKQVIANVDKGITAPLIERMYQHNMLYHPDPTIKGDLRVRAKGSVSLIAKEQLQLRRTEFLAQTANPVDMQIMGTDGRAELLREAVKTLDMPNPDDIIPPKEIREYRAALAAGGMGAPGGQPALPPGGGQAPPPAMSEINPAGQRMGGVDMRAA